jgi:hypothetical protein
MFADVVNDDVDGLDLRVFDLENILLKKPLFFSAFESWVGGAVAVAAEVVVFELLKAVVDNG